MISKKKLMYLGMTTLLSMHCEAELLDDVQPAREKGDLVLRLHFTVPVVFLRSTTSGNIVQLNYQLLKGTALPNVLGDETRQLKGRQGIIRVTNHFDVSDTAQTVKIQLPKTTKVKARPGADNRTLEVVLSGMGNNLQDLQLQSLAVAKKFAIRLEQIPSDGKATGHFVPKEFQTLETFVSRTTKDGTSIQELNLGYFESREEATTALEKLKTQFPDALVMELAANPATTTAEISSTQATPTNPADIADQAKKMLADGEAAYKAGEYDKAIEALDAVLLLPQNPSSERAQLLIGMARDKAGEVKKARAEYGLFLKLYPDSPEAPTVKTLMAALPADNRQGGEASGAGRRRVSQETTTTFSGSVSQYYYGGASQTSSETQDTPLNGVPQPINSSSFSGTDQKQLVTSTDMSWRRRSPDSDIRIAFSDTDTQDFMPKGKDKNKLNSFYVDYKGISNPWQFKLGRQSSPGEGVLGKFDGLLLGYRLDPQWKLNAVAGTPVDKFFDSKRSFMGASLLAENLAGHWSGNVFAIEQKADGQIDRQAIGTDIRYFDTHTSAFAQLDYDTLYQKFNAITLQGSYQTDGQTTFNVMLDRRATPTLETVNALIPGSNRTLTEMLQTRSIEQIREIAKITTTYADQALAGFTTPLNEKWQAGLDVRLTRIGALPAFNDGTISIAAQPATGNIISYSAQLIGTNLYSTHDSNVFNLTRITAPAYKGYMLSYSNLTALGDRWQLEPSLKFYTQTDSSSVKQKRYTLALRASYQIKENMSFEAEYDYEKSRSDGPTSHDRSTRNYFYLGYRYAF